MSIGSRASVSLTQDTGDADDQHRTRKHSSSVAQASTQADLELLDVGQGCQGYLYHCQPEEEQGKADEYTEDRHEIGIPVEHMRSRS
jgi:hypothetical protein